MLNVHARTIDAPPRVVGALLDRLASDDDPLWPTAAWPPVRFDGPLAVGADGGHGPIRYAVEDYQPGRRIRFRFKPELADGYHELALEPAGPGRCRLRHVMVARTRGRMRVAWPLAVRWLHDALLEDLLDNAERAATGNVRRPARWSPWVRFLRRRLRPAPRRLSTEPDRVWATSGGRR